MARSNFSATRVKPETSRLLTPHVLRRERISEHFARVTLGGTDLVDFTHMGFDQWFRLFIPIAQDSLSRLPNKLDTLAYARYLAISKTSRPVLRNYTVRAFRQDGTDGTGGPELDVDFVLHGNPEGELPGPAATWAQSCSPGDPVAILDEGIGFTPRPGLDRVRLVADESGLPAVAGILASLPEDTLGEAIIEVPADDDRQELRKPPGVDVTWVVRTDPSATPGQAALAAAVEHDEPGEPCYRWVVGEQSLPTSLRRHWVRAGVPKEDIMFCGYWRAGRGH
ncbi:siderophore-interacting protein [Prauserella cavernicola]|uniref:Siderophore-interacting protein n=1 Tax=Prauserella cavernicola TaxID=2800127 RepID=A0A934QQ66_9PSEU|nr:siderophore-interacting protein [Prauserella cavernicola]MBK1783389.1 siderophore-interacting protein [Prauserella cavernicola]